MQTNLEVIDKVAHRIMQRVQIINVFPKDLITFNMLQALGMFILPLGQNFLILHDLALEYLNMFLESLYF